MNPSSSILLLSRFRPLLIRLLLLLLLLRRSGWTLGEEGAIGAALSRWSFDLLFFFFWGFCVFFLFSPMIWSLIQRLVLMIWFLEVVLVVKLFWSFVCGCDSDLEWKMWFLGGSDWEFLSLYHFFACGGGESAIRETLNLSDLETAWFDTIDD